MDTVKIAEEDTLRREKKPGTALGKNWLFLAIALLLVFTAGYHYGRYRSETGENAIRREEGLQIAVHVKGAVADPGVYLFQANQRVADAVEAAGPLPDADLDQLNLAAYLEDGSQILVPERSPDSSTPDDSTYGRINLNTATAAELETLPGIGPNKAAAILSYREEHGSFSSPEDLLQVKGISENLLAAFREQVYVK